MSDRIFQNDFSAGWCPSDDPINGRKNALLKMENVTLNRNGILKITNGTTRMLSVFTNTLHTIYAKIINGTFVYYSGDTAGVVFRNNTSIKTSASTTRAAFNAAYNYVFGFSGDKRFKDDGTTATDLGIIKPSAAPTAVVGAAGILSGDYEYCQINVLVNGSYQAKSARSLISTASPALQVVTVTPQNPSVPSSTANETWIFRRGVNLETWYRIARVTTFGAFSDNMSDDDARSYGVTMNDFLLSVNATDTPDPILACVGPVYGRMLYFTAKQIIISDIQSPDSYDSRTVIGLAGLLGSEVFLWALMVNKKTVLVGTNKDVYILTGTYIQLPDGYLDVSADGLGVDNPPVSIDVALYGNAAIYMSQVGPVACGFNGLTVPLAPPNTDVLYKGDGSAEYQANNLNVPGAIRYPCAVRLNKLYMVTTPITSGNPRIEIYDLLGKYWRLSTLYPKMLFAAENGVLLGFDDTDKFIKTYENFGTNLLDDGSATQQTIAIRTLFFDDEKPRNLKDVFTLTLRGKTGSASVGVTVKVAFDGSTSFTTLSPVFKGLTTTEISWDIAANTTSDPGVTCKCVQVDISGQVPDFELQDISISYLARPVSELHLNILDLGIASAKLERVSTLNFIIDTHSQNVDFYPVVDGTVGTKSTFNTNKRKAVTHYFTNSTVSNVQVVTGYFVAATQTPFEFYGMLPHGVVQEFPELRKYAQAGPIEVFRYGKLKQFEIRVKPSGGTTITYNIYDQGTLIATAQSITVVDVKDAVYTIPLPKTTAGSVLTFEFYASFAFALFSARFLVAKSGDNADEKWINSVVDSNNVTV